jgi:hypothetical protein
MAVDRSFFLWRLRHNAANPSSVEADQPGSLFDPQFNRIFWSIALDRVRRSYQVTAASRTPASRHVLKRRIYPLIRISLHMTVSEPQALALEADCPR